VAASGERRQQEVVMAEGMRASGEVVFDDWQDPRGSQPSTGAAAETAGTGADALDAAREERRTLTDIEVATRLGVSRFTVRSWRLKGVGPRFLKMGRAVRYRTEDVQEYEQRVLVNPTSR
jgi:predicted DNA-binding transcriptional regulator AlpA